MILVTKSAVMTMNIAKVGSVFQIILALVLVLFSLAISVGDARVPFILSVTRQGIIFIIAISLVTPAPSQEIQDTFDRVKKIAKS